MEFGKSILPLRGLIKLGKVEPKEVDIID